MASIQAFQRMRTYLHSALQDADFRAEPHLQGIVQTALDSTDPEWLADVFHLVKAQHLPARPEVDPDEPLFREPPPNRLRGDIFIGPTKPSGHPVFLPPQSFGQRGHVLFTGATGTGKSTLLNFISHQLMERVPVMVYDTLDQTAPLLVPHLPVERLNVLDFRDYRRNILTGPPGMSQLDWIRAAIHHLMESLDIQPVTMNVLVRLCEEIVADGQVSTLPRLLERPARISRGLSLRGAASAVLARRRDRGPHRRTVRTSSRPRERNAVRADDSGSAVDYPREMRAQASRSPDAALPRPAKPPAGHPDDRPGCIRLRAGIRPGPAFPPLLRLQPERRLAPIAQADLLRPTGSDLSRVAVARGRKRRPGKASRPRPAQAYCLYVEQAEGAQRSQGG